MRILSILWSTCSTAALMMDGEIIGCVSEERFSRVKNDESYPRKAIETLLNMARFNPDDIDLVVIAGQRFDPLGIISHKWSKSSVGDRLREQHQYWYPRLYEGKEVSYLDVFADKIDTMQYPHDWDEVLEYLKTGIKENTDAFFQKFRRKVVSRHLGIDPGKVIFVHHHRAHGYYAYYGSTVNKEDKTLILTADAWGDDMNASVSLAKGGDIRLLNSSTNFIIGRLYRYITLLLGMKPDEHEYKVMGLAAYAKPHYYMDPLSVFQNTMFVDGLGFAFKEIPSDLYFYFRDKLEGCRFDNIAGAIQQYTQDILVQWVTNALQTTGARQLCFGGGVGMNIKAMMELVGLPELGNIFTLPSPSDESLAIGSAYVAMHDICQGRGQDPAVFLKPLKNAYLGPEGKPEQVKDVADMAHKKGYKLTSDPEMGTVAKIIAEGKVIGRCVGRSEFGARALGNRSIIADPRRLQVIKIINEKVKSRDFWMPFAPSLMSDHAGMYLVNPKEIKAPYMTVGFETKPLAWEHLISALHQADLTARPQVVTREANPGYYCLLEEFYRLTGVGGVLNTSFNVHGEPIIQGPEEALDVFERTGLDALLLDGYLIERGNSAQ